MNQHDLSSIIGKIKIKLKLINISINENNRVKTAEHIERIYELLNNLQNSCPKS